MEAKVRLFGKEWTLCDGQCSLRQAHKCDHADGLTETWAASQYFDDAILPTLRSLLSNIDGAEVSRMDDGELREAAVLRLSRGQLRLCGEQIASLPAARASEVGTTLIAQVAQAAGVAFPLQDRNSRQHQAENRSDSTPPADPVTFGRNADRSAIAANLKAAALAGIPFCEECAKRAAGSH